MVIETSYILSFIYYCSVEEFMNTLYFVTLYNTNMKLKYISKSLGVKDSFL